MTKPEKVSADDTLQILKWFVEDCGSQKCAAKRLGVSRAEISQVLRGGRNGKKVFEALHLTQRVHYEARVYRK